MPLSDQLSPSVDPTTRDYVRALIAETVATLMAHIDNLQAADASTQNDLKENAGTLAARITKLESKLNSDDKVMLTKAKLIRFMKEANIA